MNEEERTAIKDRAAGVLYVCRGANPYPNTHTHTHTRTQTNGRTKLSAVKATK